MSLRLFDFYCRKRANNGETSPWVQVQLKWRRVAVLSRSRLSLTFVEARLYTPAAVTAALRLLLLKGHLSLSLMLLKCLE